MPPTDKLPPWLWPRAAYVHVPFCAHHCGYCDFAIAVGQESSIELYLDALATEVATLGSPQPVHTHVPRRRHADPSHGHSTERLLTSLLRWLALERTASSLLKPTPIRSPRTRFTSWPTTALRGSAAEPVVPPPLLVCWMANISRMNAPCPRASASAHPAGVPGFDLWLRDRPRRNSMTTSPGRWP